MAIISVLPYAALVWGVVTLCCSLQGGDTSQQAGLATASPVQTQPAGQWLETSR